jgi:hypothetical protein
VLPVAWLVGVVSSLAPEAQQCPDVRSVEIVSLVAAGEGGSAKEHGKPARADAQGKPLGAEACGKVASADGRRKMVKSGDTVTLGVHVKVRSGKKDLSYSALPLGGRREALSPESWPSSCPVQVTWYKVEAEAESYSNPGNASPATIAYQETKWESGWSVPADVHPTLMHDEFPSVAHGLGVMRYKAVVSAGGREWSSPGVECRESGAICSAVHTVAYRRDDTYIGFLYELYNTPYIYGSKGIKGGNQADLLVGSDCADLAVYGKRRQHGRRKYEYTFTGGLCKYGKCTPVTLGSDGFYVDRKGARVPFGPSLAARPGDLLNLAGGHVGVLVSDNGNGQLDSKDLLMHTFAREPETVPISDCRWPIVSAKVVRWYR